MLLTIAIIILVLWALGFFAFHVAGGLIHLLLIVGIIVLIWNFVAGRRVGP
ncbi:MAG TPA: lmo0937 family membrane protein [Sphingomicrobium sp.]|nr:lmo0937 family membrane protein [Sphingomicrobium sp.]